MTDPNYTAMLFVVDRSGSMHSIRDDMVGGMEAMLREQADRAWAADRRRHHLRRHRRMAALVRRPERREDRPRSAGHPPPSSTRSEARSDTSARSSPRCLSTHVRVSSRSWSSQTAKRTPAANGPPSSVRAAVTRQRDRYGWDFVFLGANQDAALAATRLGIGADSALDYSPAPQAVQKSQEHLSRYMKDLRAGSKKGFTAAERSSARTGLAKDDPGSRSAP